MPKLSLEISERDYALLWDKIAQWGLTPERLALAFFADLTKSEAASREEDAIEALQRWFGLRAFPNAGEPLCLHEMLLEKLPLDIQKAWNSADKRDVEYYLDTYRAEGEDRDAAFRQISAWTDAVGGQYRLSDLLPPSE